MYVYISTPFGPLNHSLSLGYPVFSKQQFYEFSSSIAVKLKSGSWLLTLRGKISVSFSRIK